MKKIYFFISFLVAIIFITGCSNEENAENNQNNNSSDFPEKDINVIVPFSPGGAGDVAIRIMADVAPDYVDDVSLVVENNEGGGGIKGQTEVATADPDGYTLLSYSSSAASNPLIEDTSFDTDSFAPIAMFSFEPELLVVPKDSDIDSLEEFIDYAEDNEINVNTSGFGTSHHIGAMVLEEDYDMKFDYVHADGGGDQIQQLLGDHVEAGFLTYGSSVEALESDDIEPIGVMNEERIEQLPDTPTFKEEGIDVEYGPFRAVAAPADTPDDVMDELDTIFKDIIEDDEFKSSMEESGYEVEYGDANELQDQIDQQIEFVDKFLPTLQEGEE